MREKDYYDLDTNDAARVTADSLTYSGVVSVPFILCFGLLFDLVGRRIMSVIAFLIGAGSTIMFPAVSPSILGYDIARILFVQSLFIMIANPFINDYVQVQSRGLATSFQMVGLTLGNLISVTCIFTLTEHIEN